MKVKAILSLVVIVAMLVSFVSVLSAGTVSADASAPEYNLVEVFAHLTNADTDPYLRGKGYTIEPEFVSHEGVGVFGCNDGANAYKNGLCITWDYNQTVKNNPTKPMVYLQVPVTGSASFDVFAVNANSDDFEFAAVDGNGTVTVLTPVRSVVTPENAADYCLDEIIANGGGFKTNYTNIYYLIEELPIGTASVRIIFPESVRGDPSGSSWKAQLVAFRLWGEAEVPSSSEDPSSEAPSYDDYDTISFNDVPISPTPGSNDINAWFEAHGWIVPVEVGFENETFFRCMNDIGDDYAICTSWGAMQMPDFLDDAYIDIPVNQGATIDVFVYSWMQDAYPFVITFLDSEGNVLDAADEGEFVTVTAANAAELGLTGEPAVLDDPSLHPYLFKDMVSPEGVKYMRIRFPEAAPKEAGGVNNDYHWANKLSMIRTLGGTPLPEESSSQDPSSQGPSSQDPSSQDPSSEDPSSEDPSSEDPGTNDPDPNDPPKTSDFSSMAAAAAVLMTAASGVIVFRKKK